MVNHITTVVFRVLERHVGEAIIIEDFHSEVTTFQVPEETMNLDFKAISVEVCIRDVVTI